MSEGRLPVRQPCSSNQMEQQRKSRASQNPAQCLSHPERCACTCPWMNPGCRRGVLKLNLNRKWLNFTQWSHFFFLLSLLLPPVLSFTFLSPRSWSVHTKLCLRLREQLWLAIGVADHIRVCVDVWVCFNESRGELERKECVFMFVPKG